MSGKENNQIISRLRELRIIEEMVFRILSAQRKIETYLLDMFDYMY